MQSYIYISTLYIYVIPENRMHVVMRMRFIKTGKYMMFTMKKNIPSNKLSKNEDAFIKPQQVNASNRNIH